MLLVVPVYQGATEILASCVNCSAQTEPRELLCAACHKPMLHRREEAEAKARVRVRTLSFEEQSEADAWLKWQVASGQVEIGEGDPGDGWAFKQIWHDPAR